MRIRWLAAAAGGLLIAAFAGCTAKKDAGQSEFGSASLIEHALAGKIYFLPNTTRQLPDFSKVRPVGTVYAAKLNVPPTSWKAGFPGITDRFEWFAIVYQGTLHALAAGRYKVRVVSDDGSKVYVDGKLVLNNDGLHSVRSVAADIDLDTARHDLRIEYMQGPRFVVALQVFCTAPGGKEAVFPACGLAIDTPGNRCGWLWLPLILLLAIIAEETWRRRRKRSAPPPAASLPSSEIGTA